MHITLPICYRADAAPARGNLIRPVDFMEAASFEIAAVDGDHAPQAVVWTEGDQTRHTRYFEGSHWISCVHEGQPASAAMLRRLLDSSLTPQQLAAATLALDFAFDLSLTESSTLRTVIENAPNAHMNGRDTTLWGKTLATYRLANADARVDRQNAFFNARLRAHDLLLCEDLIYVRCAEPTLRLSITHEKRPPNEVTIEVHARQAEWQERGKVNQAIYEHRIDRLDDFRSFLEEHPVQGDYDFVDRIGEVQVLLDESIRLDDDLECMRVAAEKIRTAISTADPMLVTRQALDFHRFVDPTKLSGEELAKLLDRCLTDKSPIMRGIVDQSLAQGAQMALNRWEFRPLAKETKLSM